ncbi:hypothetical protein KUCAC02_024641 [Chaenocephalus aceratus]|uniref:Uncharacterized protein n=1 Tax=Chaenocephalus aceratus TaxID=36190 RepID=A0ACB9WIF3_CHAAC|nr:hypothetical protein KUCAC02_024641 [Chaenocephalus aceratus]
MSKSSTIMRPKVPPPLPPKPKSLCSSQQPQQLQHKLDDSQSHSEDDGGGTIKRCPVPDTASPAKPASNVPPRPPPPKLPPHRRSSLGNGLNTAPAHGVERESPADRQSTMPPGVPTRKDKKDVPKPISNGLPPTPKVHVNGRACFSKVFNGCPLKIHCATSWINPDTRDQYLIFGAEEGIYTLNLNELHETSMEQLFPRRCTWLYVMNSCLLSISGKASQLYSHSLSGLFEQARQLGKLPVAIPTHKLPDKMIPRKYAVSIKFQTRKVAKSAASFETQVYAHQEHRLPVAVPGWEGFEMLWVPEQTLPSDLCGRSVKASSSTRWLKFGTVNPTLTSSWFTEADTPQTCVIHVTQLKRHDPRLPRQLKSSRKLSAELTFNFQIEATVCLQDSVLAFWRHGMQGRSFKTNEITQEISDSTRIFRLLGSDRRDDCRDPEAQDRGLTLPRSRLGFLWFKGGIKTDSCVLPFPSKLTWIWCVCVCACVFDCVCFFRVVVLESRPTDNPTAHSNLYILAGHENSY